MGLTITVSEAATSALASGRFEQYVISYEDRDELHTSRWLLDGVNTKTTGNTYRGWLFMTASQAGDTVTVNLYKDPDAGSSDKVATGTADVSGIADAAVPLTLAAANASGMTGQLYLESYVSHPSATIPVLVSLCVDGHLQDEWYDIDSLPAEVYDSTYGMARHCAAATRWALLLVSQMYPEELGGYRAPEHMYYTAATRAYPDYRRLANPDQLQQAAACRALELAFGACHKMAQPTMYSELRDRFEARRQEAVASWNLAFNMDPDTDEDADRSKSASSVRLNRI